MRLYILTIIIFFSCDHRKSGDCVFGTSSPIDVSLTNDCGSDQEVSFYSYDNGAKNFELIKIITVKKNENKTTCIDNEETVTDGLYVKTVDRTKLVTLKWAETFKINLCDNSFIIDESKGPK
jgi:ribosomal protein S17